MDQPQLLAALEAAECLSVSEVTVRRAIRSGELPCIRIGRAVRISVEDLRAFADAHRSAGVLRDEA
ncbi:helix-turn-helix domain-containing protein [Solihabitans fulvus]|uniref:Helix-turn-helix domain-containing protein n=1 Tax=Solihabitans fulvus TaxID=1892852 RepID=A0A5B2XTF3_9PSEU|nr:helix-turn-helix domain-containing protein [Solihabitans fulvus]